MAGEKIILAELSLDVQGLIKEAGESKKAILALRVEQAALKKSGEEASPQFIRNEVEIQRLSAAYRQNTQAISAQVSEGGRLQNVQLAISGAVDKLNLSENDMLANNKELIKLRKGLNITDENYKKNLDAINAKIDENNAYIKENVSSYEKQKIGIGDYSTGIKNALQDTGLFNGALGSVAKDGEGVINVLQSFAPVLDLLKQQYVEITGQMGFFKTSQEAVAASTLATAEAEAVASAATGTLTANTSTLSTAQSVQAGTSVTAAGATNVLSGALGILQLVLSALGIGLILAAMVLLVAAFKNFTPLIDKVERGMAAMGAVFKVVTNAVLALWNGAKSLSDVWGTLTGDMKEAADAAAELKQAQQDLEDAMKLQEIATARNRGEINRLLIQAKDRTKSDKERLQLLEDAAKLEEQDYNQRKKNADEAYRQSLEQIRIDAELTDAEFANLKKISDAQKNTNANMTAAEAEELQRRATKFKEFVEGRTGGVDEMFDALAAAQGKAIDLDNEYYTNMEKNINKQNKLIEDAEKEKEKQQQAAEKARQDQERKDAEAAQKYQQRLNDAATLQKQELDKFLAGKDMRALSLEDELKVAERVAAEKRKIAQKEYTAELNAAKTKQQRQIAENNLKIKMGNIDKELMETRATNAVKFADQEFQAVIDRNKRILENDNFLNQRLYEQKQQALTENANAEIAHQDALFKNKEITEQEHQDAIARIKLENQDNQNKLLKERDDADKAAKFEVAKLTSQTEYEKALLEEEVRHAAEVARIDKMLADEKITKQQHEEFIRQEDRTTAANKMRLLLMEHQRKIGLMQQVAAGIGEAFGQNKELAIAQANMAGAQAILSIWAGQISGNPLIDTAIKAVLTATTAVTTAKQIMNIKNQKKPKAPQFARGGFLSWIGGKRHRDGGTNFVGDDGTRFEAEQGEIIGVMNRNAAQHFMAFNNAFPAGGASVSPTNYLAAGGSVMRSSGTNVIDYDLMKDSFAEAVSSMPAPVVQVVDILDNTSNYIRVEQAANF